MPLKVGKLARAGRRFQLRGTGVPRAWGALPSQGYDELQSQLGVEPYRVRVSWIELEVPAAGATNPSGTLAATEDTQDSFASSGNVIVAGTLAATDTQDSLSSSGNVIVAGTLAATEAQDSLASSGSVIRVFGTLAATDAQDSLSASGSVIVSGALAATDAQDSFASSGSVIVAGTFAATDEQDTLAAVGYIPIPVVGTLAATDQQDSLTSSGLVIVAGTLAATDAQDTLSSSGSVVHVHGALAATEQQDSLAASGNVIVAGTLAATDAQDSLSATGLVIVAGTLAATDAQDSLSSSGLVIVAGTLAATDAQDSLTASGNVIVAGTLAATEAQDAFDATGLAVAVVTGTLAATEAQDAFDATGSAFNNTGVFGTLDATEAQDALSASGDAIVAGTLAATEQQDQIDWSGSVIVAGTLAATDAQDSLVAPGLVIVAGTLAATDTADLSSISGRVVHIHGALAATDSQDSTALSGAVTHAHGALAATEAQDSLSGAGVRGKKATLTGTDATDTFAGVAEVIVAGTFLPTEPQDIIAWTGLAAKLVTGTLAATEESADDANFILYHGDPIYGVVGGLADWEAGEVKGDPSIPHTQTDIDDGAVDVEATAGVLVETTAFFATPSVSRINYVYNSAVIGYFPLYPVFRDFVSVSDGARLSVARAFAEQVWAFEDIHGVVRALGAADGATASDLMSVVASYPRVFSDGVTAMDSVSLTAGFTVSLAADSIAALDALSRAMSRQTGDGVTTLDALVTGAVRYPTEVPAATDALTRVVAFRRDMTDSASPDDAAARTMTKPRADTTYTSEGVAIASSKPLNDEAILSDVVANRVAKAPSEAPLPLDSMSYYMTFYRALTDSVGTGDSFSQQNPGHIWKVDDLSATDLMARFFTRPLADSRPVTDAVSLTPRLVTGHSVSPSDSGTILHEGGYADDYFAEDYTELTLVNF